jgi:hypothetical protein
MIDMRLFFTLFLLATCVNTFGQSNFNTVIQNVKIASLPYTTDQGENRYYIERMKKLHSADSTFIVEQLRSTSPRVVNPHGGTAFGNLDCEDSTDCLDLNSLTEISIICIMKQAVNSYLIHIQLHEAFRGGWRGILLLMNSQGKISDWMFSEGSANGGNPHGNLSRYFTIMSNGTIKVTEESWGDNTETYTFIASLKIIHNKFVLKKRKLFAK